MHESGMGPGAGRITSVFLQQFETLSRVLPELGEGAIACVFPLYGSKKYNLISQPYYGLE